MNRILIIRLDGLGDTLLTLPLVAGLKDRWPACQITYLASPRGAAVFAGDSRVDDLWVEELSALSRQQKWDLGQKIRTAAFDIVFCLNEKFWPAVWTGLSAAEIRLGFDPGWTQPPKALLRRLTLTHRVRNANNPQIASIHEVERYAAMADLAGCTSANGPLQLALPDHERNWAKSLMATFPLALAGGIPLCLHLSAKWSSEGWSESTALTVAQHILDRFPTAFLCVTAGPAEEGFFAGAAAILPPDRFRLFSGLSFAEWAALMSCCRALVSMDTGAIHLAAAVGTPVVDIFPELNFVHTSSRWAPWQTPHRIIRRPRPEMTRDFFTEIHAALEDLL